MHGIIVSLCSDLTGIHVEDCPSSILQHKNTKTNKRKRVGLLNVQRNVCAVIHSFLSIQTLPPPQPGGGITRSYVHAYFPEVCISPDRAQAPTKYKVHSRGNHIGCARPISSSRIRKPLPELPGLPRQRLPGVGR